MSKGVLLTEEGARRIARALPIVEAWRLPLPRRSWYRPPRRSGAGSGTALLYAEIQSSAGTSPPFLYTVRAVTPSGSGGFGAPSGSDFSLHNLAEIGVGSSGVHEIPDGAIVAFWISAQGDRFFDRSFYRGTY